MFNKAIYSKVLFVFFCSLLLCSCQKSFQDRKTLRTTRSEIVKINTELGITYMQNQQYDDAEEKLKKVIKIDPRNTDALNAMALLKSRTNQEKLADYYFQKALRADSNNPIINNNYGQFLCTIGLYKQGLNYLEIAVEKYGDNTKVIALLNSGICAKTSGDIELAISFIDSALRISPNYSNAIIELSSLMIQKQDYQRAATLLSRFNKISKPTSLSLYTGYLISKQKGQLNESKRLRILLKNLFPFLKKMFNSRITSTMKANNKIILSTKQALLFYGIESQKPFQIDGNMANVGDMLRHAREFRNISIELLAAKLNLEPKIIRKIETNRFESLSGETFIKGYISLLARELGADVQPLMQVYQLQLQREQTCDFQVDSTRGISFKKKLGYALIIIVFALSVYYLSYAIQAKFTDNNVDNSLHHLELK